MIADELRRQADEFIDLITLVPKIGRDPGERVPRYPSRTPVAPTSPPTDLVNEQD